ncbi:MAG TPA: hypothetical protein VM347_20120, partial [Nonomuraea sp.]|nr:hypothetical protein [Nonomuraea sp.]
MSPRSERQHVVEQIEDPFVRRAVRGAYHVRRYMPFYVLGLVWALSLAVFPSVNQRLSSDDGTEVGVGADAGDSGEAIVAGDDTAGGGDGTAVGGTEGVAAGADGTGTAGGTGSGGSGGSGASGGSRTVARTGNAAAGVVAQTGKTKAGLSCAAGVRQLPVSSYAIPCRPAFTGDNGGATYRGVTKDKIRVIRRNYPDSANAQAVDQVNQSAGFASRDTEKQVRNTWIPYLNKYYELYGRTVEWIEWEGPNGNSTSEAQSQGREGACADATKVVEEVKAFAVATGGGSSPFSECAAERKLMVTSAAAYFPDDFYR